MVVCMDVDELINIECGWVYYECIIYEYIVNIYDIVYMYIVHIVLWVSYEYKM